MISRSAVQVFDVVRAAALLPLALVLVVFLAVWELTS